MKNKIELEDENILDAYKNYKTNKRCKRCNSFVYKEIDKDLLKIYPYVCLNCNENMFNFEVY